MIHNVLSLALLAAPEVRTEVYRAPARLDAIEYDVIVPPGADPGRIALRFDGRARLEPDGSLLVERPGGSALRHSAPVSYQVRGSVRTYVPSRFRLGANGAAGFEIGAYDRSLELVIDPVVTASRYFDLRVLSFALDRNTGNAYVGALGSSSLHKVSPLGVILSSTVPVPGTIFPFDRMTTDNAGSLYFATRRDCPAGTPAIGSVPGGDIFVGKLNPNLTTFAYTLCIRPGPFDTVGSIATDGSGALYVAGATVSDSFPATGNFGTLISGKSHLYVFKVNPAGTNLAYSIVTGNDIQKPYIAVENNGNAYVAGMTGPQFEPRQAFRPLFEGGAFDAFLLRILPDGSNIPFATFLGGTNATGVAVDLAGNPVVGVGAASLPVAGPFSLPDTAPAGNPFGRDIYVAKFSANGQQLLLGTYIQGTWPGGVAGSLTSRGNDVYVAGRANHAQPASIQPINPLTVPDSPTDAFVVKLDSQFQRVLATNFGGSDAEEFAEIAASKQGFAVFGQTTSADLPARVNAPSSTQQNGYAGFVAETADVGIQVLRKTNQHRVTVTNFGQENATSVKLLGLFVNNPIVSTSIPCSTINIGAASNLDCELGTMFKNETRTVIVTTANAVNGSFSISSALNDPNGGNNQ